MPSPKSANDKVFVDVVKQSFYGVSLGVSLFCWLVLVVDDWRSTLVQMQTLPFQWPDENEQEKLKYYHSVVCWLGGSSATTTTLGETWSIAENVSFADPFFSLVPHAAQRRRRQCARERLLLLHLMHITTTSTEI